jgi:hypothetical protein
MDPNEQKRQEEAKAALTGFLGNMYKDAREADSLLASPSTTLKPSAGKAKQAFEKFVTSTAVPVNDPVPAVKPAEQTVTIAEPVSQVVEQTESVNIPVNDNQIEFHFDESEKGQLFSTLDDIQSSLQQLLSRVNKLSKTVAELKEQEKI